MGLTAKLMHDRKMKTVRRSKFQDWKERRAQLANGIENAIIEPRTISDNVVKFTDYCILVQEYDEAISYLKDAGILIDDEQPTKLGYQYVLDDIMIGVEEKTSTLSDPYLVESQFYDSLKAIGFQFTNAAYRE